MAKPWKQVDPTKNAWLIRMAEEEDLDLGPLWLQRHYTRGRPWPLLNITVSATTRRSIEDHFHFNIGGSKKTSEGAWWAETHGVPVELLADVKEMFDELIAKLGVKA